eukprot:1157594-Pelagomonas_calceolata.AAC.7
MKTLICLHLNPLRHTPGMPPARALFLACSRISAMDFFFFLPSCSCAGSALVIDAKGRGVKPCARLSEAKGRARALDARVAFLEACNALL